MLHGIRVLDLSWVLAGPYATRLLADLGAEVIKIQSGRTTSSPEDNQSGYFRTWNRNKLAITLDLDQEEARILFKRLTGLADVVLENFSPRVMANWNLSYEELIKHKPDLIMLSMSGFGQTGPWKDRVAFGPTIHALSGMSGLTSSPHEPPVGPGFAYADMVSGLYGVLLVLAALEHRDHTGQGTHIDLSEYEAMCSLLEPWLAQARDHPNAHFDDSEGHPTGCFPVMGPDRWCALTVRDHKQWRSLCLLIGRSEWADDPEFDHPDKRRQRVAEIQAAISNWSQTLPSEIVVEQLQNLGIAAGLVQNADDLVHDPQLQIQSLLVKEEHPDRGPIYVDRCPVVFNQKPPEPLRPAPTLGQHNQYVFMELLGLSEKELRDYIHRRIIA